MPKAPPTKKLYSLSMNGREIVSVVMETPDFLPCRPNLNRHWLRGIVETHVRANLPKSNRATPRHKAVKTVKA